MDNILIQTSAEDFAVLHQHDADPKKLLLRYLLLLRYELRS